MARPLDPVRFTRESAERIANVVQAIEATPPRAAPLRFGRNPPVKVPKQVRAATFTGVWEIGTLKTVAFLNAPTATAVVTNLCSENARAGSCVVGKEGTTWYLVESLRSTACMSIAGFSLTNVSGYLAGAVQVLGHNTATGTTGPCLQWYSTVTCS